MTFDIYQLDQMDPDEADNEKALENYQDALLEQFSESPEGQAYLQNNPGMGFWINQLIYYGYIYNGVTIPQMTDDDVEEIITDLFARKISLVADNDGNDAIPELVAFWQYLKREYKLPDADAILKFLHQIEPRFKNIMNDPSKFGMAKSFMMMGQEAGFDMTSEEDINKFMLYYNATMAAQNRGLDMPLPGPAPFEPFGERTSSLSRAEQAKKRKRRKLAKASRKKNRKK